MVEIVLLGDENKIVVVSKHLDVLSSHLVMLIFSDNSWELFHLILLPVIHHSFNEQVWDLTFQVLFGCSYMVVPGMIRIGVIFYSAAGRGSAHQPGSV